MADTDTRHTSDNSKLTLWFSSCPEGVLPRRRKIADSLTTATAAMHLGRDDAQHDAPAPRQAAGPRDKRERDNSAVEEEVAVESSGNGASAGCSAAHTQAKRTFGGACADDDAESASLNPTARDRNLTALGADGAPSTRKNLQSLSRFAVVRSRSASYA